MVVQARKDLRTDTAKPRSTTEEEHALARAAAGIAVESGDAVGYSAGDGGTFTQTPNKNTTVVINKLCGSIITSSASLAANTSIAFEFDNTYLAATDVLALSLADSGDGGFGLKYLVSTDVVADGYAVIVMRNITAGALATALTINFAVIKGSVT